MYVVGLTGGIGSGKTTVANRFQDLGITLVDADLLAREVVEPDTPGLRAITERFGHGILDDKGQLNRTALRQIVFTNESEKTWLENLLHPAIRDLMLIRIKAATSAYTLLVSPLLLETNQHQLVNRVLVVDVSVNTQLERTLKRDGSNEATIKAIIDSQIDRDSRLSRADDVISNEESIETLTARVLELHRNYLKLSEA